MPAVPSGVDPCDDRTTPHLQTRARIDEGGRLVIPAEFRRAAGINPGDTVLLRFEGGDIRVLTVERAVAAVQEWAKGLFPPDRILSDELVAERRAEARRE